MKTKQVGVWLMGGAQRRDFTAGMSLMYCGGNPRLTESVSSRLLVPKLQLHCH